jgi:hypothetical protein
MVTAEALAHTALNGESLKLRSLAQDFVRDYPQFADIPRPVTSDAQVLGTAAALVELLADHAGQTPPAWTCEIGSVPRPVFLLKAASTMPRLRALCESESPEPLRRRGLFAPPEYLTFK